MCHCITPGCDMEKGKGQSAQINRENHWEMYKPWLPWIRIILICHWVPQSEVSTRQMAKDRKVMGALYTGTRCLEPPATALQEFTKAKRRQEWINEGKHIKLLTIQSPLLPLSYRVLCSHPIPQVFGFGQP